MANEIDLKVMVKALRFAFEIGIQYVLAESDSAEVVKATKTKDANLTSYGCIMHGRRQRQGHTNLLQRSKLLAQEEHNHLAQRKDNQ